MSAYELDREAVEAACDELRNTRVDFSWRLTPPELARLLDVETALRAALGDAQREGVSVKVWGSESAG